MRLVRSLTSETSLGGSGGPDLGQDDEQIKQNILTNALKHVNSKGWTRNAIKAGRIVNSSMSLEVFALLLLD